MLPKPSPAPTSSRRKCFSADTFFTPVSRAGDTPDTAVSRSEFFYPLYLPHQLAEAKQPPCTAPPSPPRIFGIFRKENTTDLAISEFAAGSWKSWRCGRSRPRRSSCWKPAWWLSRQAEPSALLVHNDTPRLAFAIAARVRCRQPTVGRLRRVRRLVLLALAGLVRRGRGPGATLAFEQLTLRLSLLLLLLLLQELD